MELHSEALKVGDEGGRVERWRLRINRGTNQLEPVRGIASRKNRRGESKAFWFEDEADSPGANLLRKQRACLTKYLSTFGG